MEVGKSVEGGGRGGGRGGGSRGVEKTRNGDKEK